MCVLVGSLVRRRVLCVVYERVLWLDARVSPPVQVGLPTHPHAPKCLLAPAPLLQAAHSPATTGSIGTRCVSLCCWC